MRHLFSNDILNRGAVIIRWQAALQQLRPDMKTAVTYALKSRSGENSIGDQASPRTGDNSLPSKIIVLSCSAQRKPRRHRDTH